MTTTAQIAKHIREIHFGGNWSFSNLKETLLDLSYKDATKKLNSFNTIATLTFHINYYVAGIIEFLEGKPLLIKDKFSFNVPNISSDKEWKELCNKVFKDAEKLASLVEKLPDSLLNKTFVDEKYGNYYRNLHGVIEHSHYHLGQIVILKKLLKQQA